MWCDYHSTYGGNVISRHPKARICHWNLTINDDSTLRRTRIGRILEMEKGRLHQSEDVGYSAIVDAQQRNLYISRKYDLAQTNLCHRYTSCRLLGIVMDLDTRCLYFKRVPREAIDIACLNQRLSTRRPESWRRRNLIR